jgi:dihydrofolate reductase
MAALFLAGFSFNQPRYNPLREDLSMKLSLIVAHASNRVIGRDNDLPWHLSADLKRFKAITWSKPILMGRKTYESIGRPLPGRHNIILTSKSDYLAEGCSVAHTYEEAEILAGAADELVVIGGAALYQRFLLRADRLYLTLIDKEFEGDTYFPPYSLADWRVLESQTVIDDPTVDFSYRLMVLDRPLLGC